PGLRLLPRHLGAARPLRRLPLHAPAGEPHRAQAIDRQAGWLVQHLVRPRHQGGDAMNLRNELSDIFHERTNYDFVGPKKKWFAISGAFILIGLAALGVRGGLNLGIDFKGGTSWEVKTHGDKPTTASARSAVEAAG